MLLDKLAQCIMGLHGCVRVFKRVPGVDPATQACKPCKSLAFDKIIDVLRGDLPFSAMRQISVPKAWMFGSDPNIIEAFATHAANVDDDAWIQWWKSNTLGQDQNERYPSHRAFFDRVIARYANLHLTNKRAEPVMTAPIHEMVRVEPTKIEPTQVETPAEPATPEIAVPETPPAAEVKADEGVIPFPTPDHKTNKKKNKRGRNKADAPASSEGEEETMVESHKEETSSK